jgi:hypothetical protein
MIETKKRGKSRPKHRGGSEKRYEKHRRISEDGGREGGRKGGRMYARFLRHDVRSK